MLRPYIYLKKYRTLLLLISLLAFGFLGLIQSSNLVPRVTAEDNFNRLVRQDIKHDLIDLQGRISFLDRAKARGQIGGFDSSAVEQRLTIVRLLTPTDPKAARKELNVADQEISRWQTVLKAANDARDVEIAREVLTPPNGHYGPLTLPILLYHKTPGDFEHQLASLISKGYTTVDLDQVSVALRSGGALPPKPVVITFDDGFTDQMQAFDLLQKHGMKATYYIVSGGEASKYCIGANRHAGSNCGDSYLNWDQIRQIDESNLMTIAGHTVNHVGLAGVPPNVQRFEIFTNKAEIEAQLGHSIRHFAYPYGSMSAGVVSLVQEAGYATAVSTLPGISQSTDTLYSLHRVRSTYQLP